MVFSNTEPPSEIKIKQLRAQGVTPHSHFTTRALVAIGVILVINNQLKQIGDQLSLLWLNLSINSVLQVSQLLFRIVLWLVVVTLLIGVITHLVQRKFLIVVGLTKFSIVKLWQAGTVWRGILNLIPYSIRFCCILLLTLLGMFWSFSRSMGLHSCLGISSSVFLRQCFVAVWDEAITSILAAIGAMALITYIAARIEFRLKHGMSRAEVVKEQMEER